jgi:hypothetical protein
VYNALAQITVRYILGFYPFDWPDKCNQGFVPTLIIVRIGLGISAQDTHSDGTKPSSSYRLSAMRVRMDVNVETDGSESAIHKHADI